MALIREAWLGVVQDAEGNEETELVTLTGCSFSEPQATIELTDGTRITLTEPAAGDSPVLGAA